MTALLTETWTAANGSLWYSPWKTLLYNNSTATIQNNAGVLGYPLTGGYTTGAVASVTSIKSADWDFLVDVTFSDVATEQYFAINCRNLSPAVLGAATNCYELAFYPGNGANSLGVGYRDASGARQTLSGDLAAGTWTAGVARRVRFQVIGSTLRVRIWAPGGTEPSTWLWSGTDTRFGGAYGFEFNTSSGAAAVSPARTVTLDNLTITDGAAPVTTGATVIDRWDGTTLVRQRVDLLRGGVLVLQRLDHASGSSGTYAATYPPTY